MQSLSSSIVRITAVVAASAVALGSRTSAAQSAAPTPTLNLMPVPRSLRVDPGRLVVDSTFRVAVTRVRDARLLGAARRLVQRMAMRTGIVLADSLGRDTSATLVVDVRAAGPSMPSLRDDESYTIDVTAAHAVLRAPTVAGALHGLETVRQLVTADSAGFWLPLVHIDDRPRFPWRGLLIDVSRHFEPVDVIERNLDAMAAVKLNVLHWHLSDDQGVRVESKRYPRLQKLASGGQYYTQAQIRQVVAYARDRGIRVVPEFDMPGHSTAWFVAYPSLASAPGPYELSRDFHSPGSAFDPTKEAVYRFIDRFVGEMATLFPDPYWHIGGDEVNPKTWDESPRIRRFMRRHHLADAEALQAYFNRRIERILAAHHRHMVGWDEILRPDLPRSVVVQSWRGAQSLSTGAHQGYQGILSAGYYLDAMTTAGAMYAVDPAPAGSDLDSAQAARILGGEVCMWGELVDSETIDSRLWPRTAAVAERLWSSASVVDQNDMYRRLAAVSVELEGDGVRHLAGPAMLWRRIAGTDGIGPLRDLTRSVEPVTLGQRMRLRRPSTLTPLMSPGDIVPPDARDARVLSSLVDTLLSDSPGRDAARDSIAALFGRWRALPAAVAALHSRAPLLADADSAAAVLATLGAIGAQALTFVTQRTPPPAGWVTSQLAAVDSTAMPHGLLRFPVGNAVRRLIVEAGNVTTASPSQQRQ